ncbi:cysteine--tRNA ligase [Leptolinea tardivitalis]|uniref:Cysteine--tRNA ligase n=1 Tax=Leptolinea tardivitalis TaxID=229920 RepID=A0A0P6XQG0_9CHLR|nr:cysteine--tRNA ligase [Leptolinea tardivitalis]KPL71673.1 cysteinyl-tRNA synthetase [Leptolinea tardivitalis]GAP20012.1 cysteinyl-tRNA synthetase [Leptolinea tardivitalis]
MGIKIYNTLTRKKEDFVTIEPHKVRMYVCGPTVYSNAHIGHAMSSLVFDIIKRYLEYRGYSVNHVMNFTDVDDKIINRANQQGVDPFELAEGYIKEFRRHLADLNILPATFNPRATQEMPQILEMIQGLIDKGYAYPKDGDVYFRVTRDEDYGKLSGRKLDEMQAGARIDVDDRKEHPMDFALWKAAKPDEPAWDTAWGRGRPGWHIECSAMNLAHLGEQIDIHGGGNDLIFPHHENEIAQSESFTGKPFSRYWVHNGMLTLSGEKMSKSIGNLVSIDEFLSKHSASTLRLMVLNSGYRSPLTFNDEVIGAAEKGLERLRSALKPALPGASNTSEDVKKSLDEQIKKTRDAFIENMDDDFNSAGALGNLFDLVRVINQARADGASDEILKPAQAVLNELCGVFGLILEKETGEDQSAAPFIDYLVELRTEMRKQKLFAFSDQIRDRLSSMGIVLEDSKDGTTWHRA